jgi:glycosyltransferase involved in cell wall biosynthesis
MACGAPIVARDTVFNREVLGKAGVFVDDSPETLVREVRALLADDGARVALRRRARERVRERYSWDEVLNSYHRELLSAAGLT